MGKQYSDSVTQLYLDLPQDLGLIQTVQDPTRGNNIFDLFFTNNINLITKTSVISGVSDHQAVTIESKLFIKHKKPSRRVIQLWEKVDQTKIKLDAKNFNYLLKYTHNKQDPNDMWLCIKSNILTIIEDNVPTKMSSTKVYQP